MPTGETCGCGLLGHDRFMPMSVFCTILYTLVQKDRTLASFSNNYKQQSL